MSNKTLLIAGIIAAVVIILGVIASSNDKKTSIPEESAEASKELFPSLKDNANNVVRIAMSDGTNEIVVERDGDQWVMASKGGYPVQMDMVRSLVLDIADMEKVEEKTSNPEMYSRIDVQEPEAGANAKSVRLYADGDKELAAVIVGKSDPGTEPHQYVRKIGDETSWLVTGRANLNVSQNSWLETEVVNIDSSRPKAVHISHSDGEVVDASRENPTDTDFELETLPEGRELKSEYVTREFSRMLTSARMDDVTAVSELALEDPETELQVVAFNGLQVNANVYQADGEDYITFEASVDEDQIEIENERLRSEAEAAAPVVNEVGEETEETIALEPELIVVEDIQKEADEINAKVGGWAYKFPSYIQDRLTRRNEYFLKEVEQEGTDDAEEQVSLPMIQELDESTSPGTTLSTSAVD